MQLELKAIDWVGAYEISNIKMAAVVAGAMA